MKRIFAGFFLFCSALSYAHADTNIQTVVDIVSGEQLYACNASIRHPIPEGVSECVDLSTGKVCDPANVQPGDGACSCRTKRNVGDTIVASRINGGIQTAIANNNWVRLVDLNQSFGNKLSSIDINLGSEDFGAEYAVQFCYLGSEEIKAKEDQGPPIDLSEGKYQLDVTLTGVNYKKALLTGVFSYQCDLRELGSQDKARKKNEESPSNGNLENDISGTVTFFNDPNGERSGLNYLQQVLVLNSTATQVPRFCLFELRFKERSGNMAARNAQLSDGNFTGKIRICKQGTCPSGF